MRERLLYFPLPMPSWESLTDDLDDQSERALWRLVVFYARNGGVPADDLTLARIARVNIRVWRRMRPALALKFPVEGWRWPEIDQQIAKRERISVQKSLAAKQGNFKRWGTMRASDARFGKRKLVPPHEH